MTAKHWALLAGFLTMLGAQLAGLEAWDELTKPIVLFPIIGQIGVLIGAVFVEPVAFTKHQLARRSARRAAERKV